MVGEWLLLNYKVCVCERGIDRCGLTLSPGCVGEMEVSGGGPISVGTGKGVKGGRDGVCPGFSPSLVQARGFCLFRGGLRLIDAICPAALLLPQLGGGLIMGPGPRSGTEEGVKDVVGIHRGVSSQCEGKRVRQEWKSIIPKAGF